MGSVIPANAIIIPARGPEQNADLPGRVSGPIRAVSPLRGQPGQIVVLDEEGQSRSFKLVPANDERDQSRSSGNFSFGRNLVEAFTGLFAKVFAATLPEPPAANAVTAYGRANSLVDLPDTGPQVLMGAHTPLAGSGRILDLSV